MGFWQRILADWRAGDDREPETRPGAGSVFNRYQRLALLAAFVLLIVFRLPQAWVHGRFLDEEATVFLAYAWHFPGWDALFRPFGGYWNLGANATTLLAAELVRGGLLPLERAPYVTMSISLAMQALPAVLILTGSAAWLSHRLAVICALLFLAMMPGTEEVFYNAMHIQYHLALCVAIILAIACPRRRVEKFFYGTLLFLAPLFGLIAIIISPLFALRAVMDRDLERAKQLIPLLAGTAIQMLLFYSSSPIRSLTRDLATVAATMFVRMISLPTQGLDAANSMGFAVRSSQMAGSWYWWGAVAVTIVLFGALVVHAARKKDDAIWLALAGLSIAFATFSFGMVIVHFGDLFSAGAGERYNFLPLTLVGLALIAMAMRPNVRGKLAYVAICAVMVVTGVLEYPKPLRAHANGPSWPAEVQAWRKDHRHPLAVWPKPWAADLSDEPHVCSPIGRNVAASNEPRYCESGWVASFFRSASPPKRRHD